MRFWLNLLLSCLLVTALVACSGNRRQRSDPVVGERIAVLSYDNELKIDEELANVPVRLSPPYRNSRWAQPGGVASHAIYHLSLPNTLERLWRTNIGKGRTDNYRILSEPVVDKDRIYTIDSRSRVSAVDALTGRIIWQKVLPRGEERTIVGFGGGLALGDNRVFVTTGYGYVAALNQETGDELWRFEGLIPIRAAPTYDDRRVFFVTQDNQIVALDAASGEQLWDQVGITENAGILGGASPAVSGNTTVVALSSGELFAMRVENGQIAWQDSVARARQLTPLADLADIDGHPVIDRGRVYAVSHSGRTVAVDLRTGERVWEADLGGLGRLWVSGTFGYAVTTEAQVVCISLADGRVRWITPLQRYIRPDDRREVIDWQGPVLAGDRLIVASPGGYMMTISPYTGEFLSGISLKAGVSVPPIVANDRLYILDDKGDLIAYGAE